MNLTRRELRQFIITFSIAIILAVILITLIALLNTTVVTVYVDGELKLRHLILGEREFKLSFNSSITGTPVTLYFKIERGEIKGYTIEADEAMMEYYSTGLLNVSETLKNYRAESLTFCSTQRFEIAVDGRELKLRDACVKIEVYGILFPRRT